MHPNTLKVLRALAEHESLTMAQVDQILPDLCDSGSKGALLSLRQDRLIDAERVGKYPAYYRITAQGRQKLRALSGTQDKGDVAAPRQPVSSGQFTGTKWRIRDGGGDHLAYLSRRGDDYVEHRPMISMGGAVEAVGVHGGRV